MMPIVRFLVVILKLGKNMTKKEFEYWKEHKEDILNAHLVCIHLNNYQQTDEARVALDSHYNSSEPTVKRVTYFNKVFETIMHKIIDVSFIKEDIIIKMQREHSYEEDNTIKWLLVGPIITNRFKRCNIKSIEVRNNN